jgi:hypothetical protein
MCRSLKAALNFSLSFFRIVTLGGTLLILRQHRMYFFEIKKGWHLDYEDEAYSLY